MGLDVDHLPESVGRRLNQFYRRKRLYALGRVVMWTLLVGGALALIAMHIDRFAFLDRSTRYALVYGTYVIAGGIGLISLLGFFLNRPGPREIAYELENKLPSDTEEKIVSLEDLLRHPDDSVQDDVGQKLLEELQEATVAESGEIDAGALVTDRWAKYLFWACLGLVFVYGLFFLPDQYEFDLMVKRFAMPGKSLPKPSFVKLSVSPEEVVRGTGGEVTLRAETKGTMPQPMKWIVRTLGGYSERCLIARKPGDPDETNYRFASAKKDEMSRVHRELFLYSATDLQETFQYRVRYADAQTEIRTVRIVEQPKVTNLKLTVQPPEYTGREKKVISDPGEGVSILKGSDVTVSFRTDRPVKKRQIVLEDGEKTIDLETKEDQPARHKFTVTDKIRFKIKVVDRHGFENVQKPIVSLIPRQDQKPSVQMQYPAGRLKKVPGGIVPMKVRIKDDLGVEGVTLQYFKNPDRKKTATAREKSLALDEQKGDGEITMTSQLDLGETGAVPGDTLMVRIRARDTGGNDGVSRKIFVEVVPFTRGANERRRLQALMFLRKALHHLATTEKQTASGFEINGNLYGTIQKWAKKQSVPLAKPASVRSLLQLLELEHHFTDQSRYKGDIRRIYGALFAACEKSRTADNGADVRRKAFQRLAEEILSGLIQYRQIKNLTWRFFGMLYEVRRIEKELRTLDKQEQPSSQELKALTRRAKLYLESLMDLGEELTRRSRRTSLLKEEEVSSEIGELNTAAYRFKTGSSLAVRAQSSRKVKQRIRKLLNMIFSVLADLQKRDVTARQRLQQMYRSSLLDLESPSADWVDADASMLHRNPFAPVWPQFLRFAFSSTSEDQQKQLQTLYEKLLKPASERPPLSRSARLQLAQQAFQMQAEEVRSREKVSNLEKVLQLRLMRIEWISGPGKNDRDALSKHRKAVQGLKLNQDVSDSNVNKLVRSFQVRTAGNGVDREALQKRVRETYELPEPSEQVDRLVSTMKKAGEALKAMISTLQDAGSEEINQELKKLLALMSREKQLMQAVSRGFWLRFVVTLPDRKTAQPVERLMLIIRRKTGRYNGRVAAPMDQIRRRIKQAQGQNVKRAQLQAELQGIIATHKALRTQIEQEAKSLLKGEETKSEKDQTFLLMEDFQRTRRYVQFTNRLESGDNREQLAKTFIKEFPKAGLAYLSEHVGLLLDARDQLEEARNLLDRDEPDLETFGTVLAASKKNLSSFNRVVSNSGEGSDQRRIQDQVNELVNRLDRISPDDLQSKQDMKSALFELSETQQKLKGILGQVRAVMRRSRTSGPQFEGGPAGMNREKFRRDAEFTKDRLERRSRRARGIVTAGVLEALRENPDPSRFAEAKNWAMFLYRLVRSELAGVGRVTRKKSGSEGGPPPHIKFLRKELSEAKKTDEISYYQDAVEVYLELVDDYLQY